jgi:hypothetical protein
VIRSAAKSAGPGDAATATEPRRAWTRREWLKTAAMVGGAAGAGALAGITVYPALFPPQPGPTVGFRDAFVYFRFPGVNTWWNHLAGQDVHVTDFQEWQGASTVWNGTFDQGTWVQGTGFPALVIRVKRESQYFSAPTDLAVPSGYSLYYDDPLRDLRIVAFFDRSTNLCCYPGWHVVTNPPPTRDYIAPCPTYAVFGQDPMYDVCHGGQWDPLILEWGWNPQANIRYIGARMVHGPGFGPLPSLLVHRADNDVLYGATADSNWYRYC